MYDIFIIKAAYDVGNGVVSLILARNWLPRPSPLDAPATKPAISTNSILVETTRSGLTISASCPVVDLDWYDPCIGSMVQNGKFCASIPALVNALNRVDLPTFGKPTMPHLNPYFLLYAGEECSWLDPSQIVTMSFMNVIV